MGRGLFFFNLIMCLWKDDNNLVDVLKNKVILVLVIIFLVYWR